MEGLNAAKIYLNEISSILKPSFGPSGKDVLLKSATGVTYLTKNGSMVIQQLDVKHPIHRLIKNAVQSYSDSVGDFSKAYLLILDSLIDLLIKKHISGLSAVHMQLHSTLSSISNLLLKLRTKLTSDIVLEFINLKGYLVKTSPDEFVHRYFDRLFSVVVCGKFNVDNTKILKMIITDILQYAVVSRRGLLRVIKNYRSICIEVNGIPFSQSKLVEGVIVQREPIPLHVNHGVCKFIVISGQTTRSSSNIELYLRDKNDISKQQFHTKSFYEKLVDILVSNDISIIFTEEKFPLLLCMLLESHNITYVPFILEEDLEWLGMVYNVSPLSGIYDILSCDDLKMVTGTAKYFKSCTLGTHICSHLGPPLSIETSIYIPFQIILCTLYEGIRSQYLEAILNIIKAVYQCFGSKDEMYLINSCGIFELSLIDLMWDTRFEFVADGVNKWNTRSNLSPESGCKLKTLIRSLTAADDEMFSLIIQSLQVIPKCIFENSSDCDNKRYISQMSGIDSSLQLDQDLLEPFHSKMKLFHSLLEVCAQIVRIDTIIPVKQTPLISNDATDSE